MLPLSLFSFRASRLFLGAKDKAGYLFTLSYISIIEYNIENSTGTRYRIDSKTKSIKHGFFVGQCLLNML